MCLRKRGNESFLRALNVTEIHQSAPSHPVLCPLPALHKTTKTDQPIHNYPEDGNCNI